MGPDRRKRKRGMFAVPVQIRGGVGTLEVFEDLVTSMDVSRDGLLLATSRGGYAVGQRLHVACPYWCTPTAINVPRNAQVIRNVLLPNYTYALALQFLPGACEEGPWGLPASPFPNQVRVLCVVADAVVARALCEVLAKDGYHVVAVSSAQEALDILRSEAPDVILAEAEGKEVSGKDLCAIVKDQPAVAAHSRDSAHQLRDAVRLRVQSSNRSRRVHEHPLQAGATAQRHSFGGGAAGALLCLQLALQHGSFVRTS